MSFYDYFINMYAHLLKIKCNATTDVEICVAQGCIFFLLKNTVESNAKE